MNRIQNLRKQSGLEITDKINITLSKNEQTDDAVVAFKDYICNQVLGASLVLADCVQDGVKLFREEACDAIIAVGGGSANGQVYVRQSSSRLPIEKLKSKSVPYMLGSENRVWGPMRPSIEADLQKYMRQQIAMLVG